MNTGCSNMQSRISIEGDDLAFSANWDLMFRKSLQVLTAMKLQLLILQRQRLEKRKSRYSNPCFFLSSYLLRNRETYYASLAEILKNKDWLECFSLQGTAKLRVFQSFRYLQRMVESSWIEHEGQLLELSGLGPLCAKNLPNSHCVWFLGVFKYKVHNSFYSLQI